MKWTLAFLALLGCRFLSFSSPIAGDTTVKPSFTIEKINLQPMQVLTIADTATSAPGIGPLLGKCYGELFQFINQQQLQPGKIMAFYYSSHEPFVFDAAVEVNKLPNELKGRVKAKKIEGGDAIIVHYQGAYDQITVAYNAISAWLAKNNKNAMEAPFEVYLNDPATVKDPALLRTDVYQKIK